MVKRLRGLVSLVEGQRLVLSIRSGSSQASIIPVAGDLTPSPGLCRHCMYMVNRHIHSGKTPTHVNLKWRVNFFNCFFFLSQLTPGKQEEKQNYVLVVRREGEAKVWVYFEKAPSVIDASRLEKSSVAVRGFVNAVCQGFNHGTEVRLQFKALPSTLWDK